MNNYSNQQLLATLIALIEVQIVAIQLKQTGLPDDSITTKPVFVPAMWGYTHGICVNIYRVPSKPIHAISILKILFCSCPSFSGDPDFPVKNINGADYYSSSPNAFWGDHPYADNRRQILQECIDQLHVELKSRGIDVG